MYDVEQIYKNDKKESPIKLLERLNIHVRIGDLLDSNHNENSFDLVFSTVVFEHIDFDLLIEILNVLRSVSSPEGVMSHYIGLSDQYAIFDKSITHYNCLKYSDRQWKIFNNPIIPLSRLRIADYRNAFKKAKLDITKEDNILGSKRDLKRIKLAPQFQKHSTKDLLVLYSCLFAKHHGRGTSSTII